MCLPGHLSVGRLPVTVIHYVVVAIDGQWCTTHVIHILLPVNIQTLLYLYINLRSRDGAFVRSCVRVEFGFIQFALGSFYAAVHVNALSILVRNPCVHGLN